MTDMPETAFSALCQFSPMKNSKQYECRRISDFKHNLADPLIFSGRRNSHDKQHKTYQHGHLQFTKRTGSAAAIRMHSGKSQALHKTAVPQQPPHRSAGYRYCQTNMWFYSLSCPFCSQYQLHFFQLLSPVISTKIRKCLSIQHKKKLRCQFQPVYRMLAAILLLISLSQ